MPITDKVQNQGPDPSKTVQPRRTRSVKAADTILYGASCRDFPSG